MSKKKKTKKEKGVAEKALHNLAGIIPGFENILKAVEKSPVFQKRLKEVNKEVEAKLKGQPLKREHIQVETGYSIRPIISSGGVRKQGAPRGARKTPIAKKRLQKKKSLVDVFDENGKVRIVAELPGAAEKDIKISRHGAVLTISADTKEQKYGKKITLPRAARGKISKLYKGRTLEVTIKKIKGGK